MTTSRLVHVGSAVVDYVYRIDALPAPGTERIAATYSRVVGGGFNMMVAAIRTGLPVAFGGQHGTGVDGDFLRNALADQGVDVLTPSTVSLDSGNCVVMITADAERTFVSWPGAEAVASEASFAPVVVEPGDWVFSSGYTLSYPGSRDALTTWIERLAPDIPFVFDPTPVVGQIPDNILSRVLARTTWLSCNSAEAAIIAGPGDTWAILQRLIEIHCPRALGVVVRAGEGGSFIRLADGTSTAVPGFAVDAVDTNGAGDTHIGAFISAMAQGSTPADAARFANAAAAISVTRHGGSCAPTSEEIQSFLANRPVERIAERA